MKSNSRNAQRTLRELLILALMLLPILFGNGAVVKAQPRKNVEKRTFLFDVFHQSMISIGFSREMKYFLPLVSLY